MLGEEGRKSMTGEIRLPPELLERVDRLAVRQRSSRIDVINQALNIALRILERNQDVAEAFDDDAP